MRFKVCLVFCLSFLYLFAFVQESYSDVFLIEGKDGKRYFANSPPKATEGKLIKSYSLLSRVADSKKDKNRNPIDDDKLVKSSKVFSSLSSKSKLPAGLPINKSSDYDHLARIAGSRHKVDHRLIKAVMKVESDFDRFSVSKKGAVGLMQLMPDTASFLNVKSAFDPHQNVNAGAEYLKMMLDRFGGDMELALAAYNAGPTTVSKYGGVPPYPETENYIRTVLREYNRYGGNYKGAFLSNFNRAARKDPGNLGVYYSYTDADGNIVFTDMPIGRKRIIER